MTDDNDGAAGARGGLFQRGEGMTEVLVAIATPSLAKIGNQRIEDDEGGVGVPGPTPRAAGDPRGERGRLIRAVWNSKERDDALGITTGGIDARADGVEQIVFGGAERHCVEDRARHREEDRRGRCRTAKLTEGGCSAEPGSPSRTVSLPAGT